MKLNSLELINSRSSTMCMKKHFRTAMRERRASYAVDGLEHKPKIRPKRNGNNLPDIWNELVRGDNGHVRTWKAYRKTQWRPNFKKE